MKNIGSKNALQKMIDVNTPIIYIQDYDFVRVDELIEMALEKKKVVEWNPATKKTHFVSKEALSNETLDQFLLGEYQLDGMNLPEKYLVLKEIDDYIEEPTVKSLLLHIAQRKLYDNDYNTTVIIVSPSYTIPHNIEKYVSFLDIDLPDEDDIKALIKKHVDINNDEDFKQNEVYITEKLMPSLKGLTSLEIDRTLDMAMSTNGILRADDDKMILAQKKQMVKQSGLLELIETKESLDDIGGMDSLKQYLKDKSKIMGNISLAHKYGIPTPKGVFIVGMPGCGKSLCAKASAAAFNAPLLKLDMGSMMGKYVGESEGNLRKAIKIAEAAAPCILWIDEIEKALSGVGSDHNNDIVTRMFGYLLGWLQEKTSSVYVIATANSADNLPPELKRKGRFDEIFCVNLPNQEERKEIFKVHLKKKLNKKYQLVDIPEDKEDFNPLINQTEGFNGADIEYVVNETLEEKFREELEQIKKGTRISITIEDLKKVADNTVSISKSCKDQIDSMKKIFEKSGFTDASESTKSTHKNGHNK